MRAYVTGLVVPHSNFRPCIRGGLNVSQTIQWHELDPLSDQQVFMTYKISIEREAVSVQVSTDLLVPESVI